MPSNLRDGSKFVLPKSKSSNLPVSVKNCQSLNKFKLELKNLENINFFNLVCRLSMFL